jgi:hypothetical protein
VPDSVHREALDHDGFASSRGASDDPYIALLHPKLIGHETDQLGVRGTVDRWRGEPDPDGVAVLTRDFSRSGSWNNMHDESRSLFQADS